ncbi:hypothetical protein FRC20_009552 [Serendipita sp. 405]|nr:hypothetical protein FRC20_009552 [Serendipita sp. 405]
MASWVFLFPVDGTRESARVEQEKGRARPVFIEFKESPPPKQVEECTTAQLQWWSFRLPKKVVLKQVS